tara:strand:+ start:94 stop:486 length:393 start_codon:yes stop_codon:yes gene_type:complete
MPEDAITEESIKALVDRFYLKVRNHEDLGPVFDNAIGDSDDAWKPHLERMYAFWSSIMLTSGRYHGNPMQKHKDLPNFNEGLFDTWLKLFEETAHEVHSPAIAERYIDRSKRIAESLKLGLYYKPERKQK